MTTIGPSFLKIVVFIITGIKDNHKSLDLFEFLARSHYLQ